MSNSRNVFLDHESLDDSNSEDGYDSEAAEVQKGGNRSEHTRVKRRKLSHSADESQEATNNVAVLQHHAQHENLQQDRKSKTNATASERFRIDSEDDEFKTKSAAVAVKASKRARKDKSKTTPGVIYLSSLPPYLKPSALRNMLQQRGFEPITRLFLAPASKAKASSKKNSRQLYTEGWIEFKSKKTARRCTESLNANIIGGKKGGFYYDDIWNMKYLKGMAWDELMAGIREERREEEGRRDEERRVIAKETQRFLDGVEEGKKMEGMKRKRKAKEQKDDTGQGENDIKRTWRQFEVKGNDTRQKRKAPLDDDVQEVLGKIF